MESIEAIPYKNFKEKIRLVKANSPKGKIEICNEESIILIFKEVKRDDN